MKDSVRAGLVRVTIKRGFACGRNFVLLALTLAIILIQWEINEYNFTHQYSAGLFIFGLILPEDVLLKTG